MKECNNCKIKKELIEFNRAKGNKDGFANQCKICRAKYNKNLREDIKNREKTTVDGKICTQCNAYKPITNFNKQISSVDGYRPSCKSCQSKLHKIYRNKNKDKLKKYRVDNKDKINRQKQYKLKTDIQYKLRAALRSRLWNALNYGYKSGSAVNDLGCDIPKLKEYIESLFDEGMTWDNWGVNGWHIDHKTPLSYFDLTKREELVKAVHYTNLQPMWANDNLTKSNIIL